MQAPAAAPQWLRRLDPRRIAAAVARRGLAGTVALVLALLACYGTLATLALLSLLGIALAVHEPAVRSVVAGLAVLAAAAVAGGRRKHGSIAPLTVAAIGAALIVFAMLLAYDWRTELAGFALLLAAVAWDLRLRRRDHRRPLPASHHGGQT